MKRKLSLIIPALLVVVASMVAVMIPLGQAPTASAMTPRLRDYNVCRIDLLMKTLNQGTWILVGEQQIPENADFLGPVGFDVNGCVRVRLYDSSFDLVPEGQDPPIINYTWHGIQPGTPPYTAAYLKGMGTSAVPPSGQQQCRDLTWKYFNWRYLGGPALTPAELATVADCNNLSRPVPPPTRFHPYIPPVLPLPSATPRPGDPIKGR